jgi:hypothetical protein
MCPAPQLSGGTATETTVTEFICVVLRNKALHRTNTILLVGLRNKFRTEGGIFLKADTNVNRRHYTFY